MNHTTLLLKRLMVFLQHSYQPHKRQCQARSLRAISKRRAMRYTNTTYLQIYKLPRTHTH